MSKSPFNSVPETPSDSIFYNLPWCELNSIEGWYLSPVDFRMLAYWDGMSWTGYLYPLPDSLIEVSMAKYSFKFSHFLKLASETFGKNNVYENSHNKNEEGKGQKIVATDFRGQTNETLSNNKGELGDNQQYIICPSCGCKQENGYKYCQFCGCSQNGISCVSCGIAGVERFCLKCGTPRY